MCDGSGGWLALIASPIGNLEDITLRALRMLREADLVAAEDTRRARKLLTHFEISCATTSYHSHNEHGKTHQLLEQVQQGRRIAVLTDAGTPAVSDPGYLLMRDAVEAGIEPIIIPGASALTFAVVACGFPISDFIFGGFLPMKSGKRRSMLRQLFASSRTVFLFESPHRMSKLLTEIVEELGGETMVAIVREATKLHEEVLRGSAAELLAAHGSRSWKGELTVGLTHPLQTSGQCAAGS